MDEKKADFLYDKIVNSKKNCDQIEHCDECPRYSQLMCLSHKIADDLAADTHIKVVVYEYADERHFPDDMDNTMKAEMLYGMIRNSKVECDLIKNCDECPRYPQPMCLSHKIAEDLAADPRIKVIMEDEYDE